jgi:CBS domain-containing protein
MTLQDILQSKGTTVHSIGPNATLDDVVQALVRNNCGSLVVCQQDGSGDEPQLVGIITERDILRACAARKAPLDELLVSDVMSSKLITGTPHDTVGETMGLLTERRIRHLPILEDGRLRGMISIGDLVKAQYQEMAMENHYMKSYIPGGVED